MPPIGWATGGVDFSDLAIELPGKMIDPATKDKPPAEQKMIPVKIGYGKFLQKLIDFLIIGLCLFLVVKGMNRLSQLKKEEPKPAEMSTTDKLLTEIRDALKQKA